MASRSRSPESEYLDTLKGKQIGIVFRGVVNVSATTPVEFLRCKLLWVDVYSYGIELDRPKREARDYDHNVPEMREQSTEMIPKSAVARLFLVEGTGYERA